MHGPSSHTKQSGILCRKLMRNRSLAGTSYIYEREAPHRSQKGRIRAGRQKARWSNFRWRCSGDPWQGTLDLKGLHNLVPPQGKGLSLQTPAHSWHELPGDVSLLGFLVIQQFCEEGCEGRGGLRQVGEIVGSPGTWILTSNSCSSKHLLHRPVMGPKSNAQCL